MHSEDSLSRSSRSSRSSKSSVWIDPAYRLPNVPSPIPPRASAQKRHSARVPVKYRGTQRNAPVPPRRVTLEQQSQSPLWQYDSPDFEIESSIAALSLVVPATPATYDPFVTELSPIDELPTRPEEPVGPRVIESTAELPTRPELSASSPVADLPTRPEHRHGNFSQADQSAVRTMNRAPTELDTVPPLLLSPAWDVSVEHDPDLPTQALIPAHIDLFPFAHPAGVNLRNARLPVRPRLIEATADLLVPDDSSLASWTAGGARQSPLAQRLIERRGQRGQRGFSSVRLNPPDRVRWWLLKPGHVEFIVWLAGTILLIAVSLALLFMTSLSFGWLTIGSLSRFSPSSNSAHPLPTIVTNPALKLELLDNGSFLPGQSIRLHGQGFTSDGDIFFTYDRMQSFSPQDMVQADVHGTFTATLTLGTGQQWYPGLHLIEARDLASGYLAAVKISIIIPASQKGSNGTNAPVRTGVPGKATPTPASGNGNGNKPTPGPNPGGQTPVPVTPTSTVGITPTPTLSPSPSPTPTNTPTPTSTPTSTPTPTSPTPTPGLSPTPTP